MHDRDTFSVDIPIVDAIEQSQETTEPLRHQLER
jgi:hypothetical protein